VICNCVTVSECCRMLCNKYSHTYQEAFLGLLMSLQAVTGTSGELDLNQLALSSGVSPFWDGPWYSPDRCKSTKGKAKPCGFNEGMCWCHFHQHFTGQMTRTSQRPGREDGGRDWVLASTSKEKQKPQQPQEDRGPFFVQAAGTVALCYSLPQETDTRRYERQLK
jgi:hypothetical protein